MQACVAECEESQAAWNAAVARVVGGRVWEDGGLRWSWQPHDGHLMLNFPRRIDAAARRRGLDSAEPLRVRTVGAWVSREVATDPLAAAGFTQGWEPWWMSAPLSAIQPPSDARVTLDVTMPEYDGAGRALLALASGRQATAAHAAARVDGALAGRAWSFVGGRQAGIFDMEVWPRFQRRGLGRALLREVCAAAALRGARTAVLNATEEGERLYSAEGFTRVGTGITWWLQRGVA